MQAFIEKLNNIKNNDVESIKHFQIVESSDTQLFLCFLEACNYTNIIMDTCEGRQGCDDFRVNLFQNERKDQGKTG